MDNRPSLNGYFASDFVLVSDPRPIIAKVSRMSPAKLSVLFIGLALLPLTLASAQFSGSRGAVDGGRDQTHESSGLAPLDPEVAEGYITIEGQAELRVKPTEIRVVLAVTAEGKTPSECKRKVTETIKSLTAAWMEAGIAQL